MPPVTRSAKHNRSLDTKPSNRESPDQSKPAPTQLPIFTIGHGTRSLADLINILLSAGVTNLVDIRTIPRSATNPQFNKDVLETSPELAAHGIEYTWFGPELGGRRNSNQPGVERHTAIRVASFRNYAGYMSTEGFLGGLERLERLGLGGEGRKGDGKGKGKGEGGFVAFMCSETLWWRCHRRMVSDALVAKGWEVRHLGMKKEGDGIVHHIWDIARVGEDGELVYDGGLGTNE